jgi:hypothetical protein
MGVLVAWGGMGRQHTQAWSMLHITSEILLGQACSSLSPGEPPLGQVIALNVVYNIILARGEREHSAITPGVNKFIGLDMANQILRMRLSAGSRTMIALIHTSRCHQLMAGLPILLPGC